MPDDDVWRLSDIRLLVHNRTLTMYVAGVSARAIMADGDSFIKLIKNRN